ncbi:BAR/IMD domain-containing adapter protein 2-like 2 isoform X4 [Callithrix jacchus]|uniref:brain-specific angiogenesis inhibitor 1-associated protein 2-like protein 2 isoform X5 n=1 Tax=Callithrix jacchus TaxID=9483 RepID=UPI0023DD1517|nr:brain-specific angiogenesis inhibitor 1-associated protein 2-like protein 2 isoform X5 [Callithrix jacchus]
MAPEMDQFYRSTMAIYKSIMEQFNPALENLVYLGNNYLRAFHALSEAAEVYFNAIQKIGERALQSPTSQILGEILVQMSDTQRHLNSDLEVVVQTFHGDLLQHMEKNTKLDMQFIKDSRQHYEIEYRHRAANLEKCMSELWRMERKRDKNVREMKESVNRLHAQMQAFVSESQRAAELEEKRRYRFLAEKHLLLSNTFLQFFGRARGMLQNRVLLWKEQSEASRSPSRAHSPGLLGPALGPPYPSGRLTPTRLDMPPRPLGEFSSPRSRHSSGSYGPEPDARPASQLEPDRRSLPRTPSASLAPRARAPTPLASGRAAAGAAGAPGGSVPWSPTLRAPTTHCCASPPGTWWRCWCPRPRTAGSTASWRARPHPTHSGAATASMTSWTGQATPQHPRSTGMVSPAPAPQVGCRAVPLALHLHPCPAAAAAAWAARGWPLMSRN